MTDWRGNETRWQVWNRVYKEWVDVDCVEDGFDPLLRNQHQLIASCWFIYYPICYRLVNMKGEVI